jgi:hypothetical protein
VPSRLDKWFSPFEGRGNPYPIAVFRVLFFAGLLLHFAPSLIKLDDAYAPGGMRTDEWSHWLYLSFARWPRGLLRGVSALTLAGCVMGLIGLRPRIAALLAGAGCYVFASFNGLPVHTLAVVDAWGVLLLFAICGGGSAVWSLDALLARDPKPSEPRLLPSLILFQTLLAVFFSGIEKLLAGWLHENEMGILLAYPKGFLVRDWVVDRPWLHAPAVGWLFTYATLAVELGTPLMLLWRRTRKPAFVVYQLFFLGIVAMLEVPPLFYFMFAGGALLAFRE